MERTLPEHGRGCLDLDPDPFTWCHQCNAPCDEIVAFKDYATMNHHFWFRHHGEEQLIVVSYRVWFDRPHSFIHTAFIVPDRRIEIL